MRKRIGPDGKGMSEGDMDLALEKTTAWEKRLDEEIFKLCVNSPFKDAEDISSGKVSAEDVLKLHAWMLKKLGLEVDKEKEGFMKT